MKKIIVILVFIIYVIGCGEKHNHDHDDHDHTEQTQTHENEDKHLDPDQNGQTEHLHLHISDKIIDQWEIRVSQPTLRYRIKKIELNGIVTVNRHSTFLIHSLVSGIVMDIRKDIGDWVRRGDTLCVINSPELLELKKNVVKAYGELRRSKADYERAKNLFEIKAIEEKSLINRETVYKAANAEFLALEAKIDSICLNSIDLNQIRRAIETDDIEAIKAYLSPYYRIPSPGEGIVLERSLDLGAMIGHNRTIFTLSNTRRIWVILDALEKDLPYITKGNRVEIHTDVFPDEKFHGEITNIRVSLDPELRTIKVRIEVDNQKEMLRPNMYVKGYIEKKHSGQFLAFPVQAVVNISGVKGIFIKDGDGFVFKPIEIIDMDSSGFVFTEGIRENIKIVVHGAFYLKAEYELKRGNLDDPHAGHQH